MSQAEIVHRLNLKAGEWVEVRSREEILATLDQRGRLDNLPFMPEMLRLCGQRFRVFKRADKTCDNIERWSIRRVQNAVHLEGARCDGADHGGCEAGCLIFWNEAWLKRVDGNRPDAVIPVSQLTAPRAACSEDMLFSASRASQKGGEIIYSCQATDLLAYTSYMPWWDPRQYVRDLRSGNLSSDFALHSRAQRVLEFLLNLLLILRVFVISAFNRVQESRHRSPYPFVQGTRDKSASGVLDLQTGELVRVRAAEEIIGTLDKQNRNRGLSFDSEMLAYCGGIYRVLRRVHHIIDEKTGRMIHMKNPCIVLEGVSCRADYHRLCPRAIYHYWRENWLERLAPGTAVPINNCREVEAGDVPCRTS